MCLWIVNSELPEDVNGLLKRCHALVVSIQGVQTSAEISKGSSELRLMRLRIFPSELSKNPYGLVIQRDALFLSMRDTQREAETVE